MVMLLASVAVAFAVACLAVGAALDPLRTPAALIVATFLSGLLGAAYAPTQSPDRLAEAVHAYQLGTMYATAERSAVGAPGAPKFTPGSIAEDEARIRAEEWTGAARDLMAELDR